MPVTSLCVSSSENPSFTKDVLCAALSCQQGGIRRVLLSGLHGATAVQGHYQVGHRPCSENVVSLTAAHAGPAPSPLLADKQAAVPAGDAGVRVHVSPSLPSWGAPNVLWVMSTTCESRLPNFRDFAS